MTRLLKGLFASMSLERKCLLFFGSALMVLMLGAFAVVEKLGRELVLNTTRQRAKDFAGRLSGARAQRRFPLRLARPAVLPPDVLAATGVRLERQGPHSTEANDGNDRFAGFG